jgi:hypothetical protein
MPPFKESGKKVFFIFYLSGFVYFFSGNAGSRKAGVSLTMNTRVILIFASTHDIDKQTNKKEKRLFLCQTLFHYHTGRIVYCPFIVKRCFLV